MFGPLSDSAVRLTCGMHQQCFVCVCVCVCVWYVCVCVSVVLVKGLYF